MRLSRFFINETLSLGMSLELPPHLVNYVVNVLRLKVGADLVLFNGQDYKQKIGEFSAIITAMSKRYCTISITAFTEKNIESSITTHLFQGISRSERMDYTIQKAVELGITHITPVFTERSNLKKLNDKQLHKKIQHWQGVATSACEQSGRSQLIIVNTPIYFKQISELSTELNLLLSPTAHASVADLKSMSANQINILIGPEGGLSETEILYAKKLGYLDISLGKRILRTETAGLVILTILQFLWGDLN